MTGDQQAIDDLWAFMEPARPAAPDDDDRWVGPPADEAKRLRDQGAADALNGADSRARGAAERALADLAESGVVFSSDDLHERIGHPMACKPSVMGALFLSAATSGLIERVGYVKSTRPSSHGREIKTWRGTGRTEPAKARPSLTPAPLVPSGTWTAADTTQPCVQCGAPAFMRDPDGNPRHRADCGGA